MRLCNFNPLQVVPGEPVENLPGKVHLMNLHAGGAGDRRQVTRGHALKGKHINSIIFRFPADFPVGVRGCLSRYSPAEAETRTKEQRGKRLLISMNSGVFFMTTGLCNGVISPYLKGFGHLIRINLTGEVSCPVYGGLRLWFEPCSP